MLAQHVKTLDEIVTKFLQLPIVNNFIAAIFANLKAAFQFVQFAIKNLRIHTASKLVVSYVVIFMLIVTMLSNLFMLINLENVYFAMKNFLANEIIVL